MGTSHDTRIPIMTDLLSIITHLSIRMLGASMVAYLNIGVVLGTLEKKFHTCERPDLDCVVHPR